MCTLHAENPKQALLRLETLIQMGAPQWSLQTIRQLIFSGINYIITLKNKNGDRKVSSIEHLQSLEDFGFILDSVPEGHQPMV